MRRLALAFLLLAGAAAAADPEPAPVALKKVPADGEHHLVKCKGATYWVLVPAGLDENKPVRVILWHHGSNMNGSSYTGSLKALGFGKEEILAAPNGDTKVREWVYNFTYDPRPALKTLDDLATRFRVGKVYVGGHSQGAFYTYKLAIRYPDRFAGAIPFAAGLLKGLDPKAAAWRKGRPGPAFAIIHGEADPVVDPELSDWAYEIIFQAGWPCVRYYHPPRLNHWFMPGPVRPALEWCFRVSADDPATLVKNASALLAEDRGAEAWFCLDRAEERKGDATAIETLRREITSKAEQHAAVWEERITKDPPAALLKECYAYREQWGQVPASARVLKKLNALRKKHVAAARKLSRKGHKHAKKKENDKARPYFEKIVEECWAAFEYARPAARWLAKN
ncbi:MAG: hypothetical protein ACYTG3_01000 [Planctomycetota bacterium]|jgi:pimeloyl-ACP methyl ester carboxylesterase